MTHVRVAIDTLGCKLNQAETERLAGEFAAAGYTLVPATEKADIYILNTCTVTHIADRKSRGWLRRAHRLSPGALVVAAGCYAERVAAELRQIEGVGLVVGNGQKSDLLSIIEKSGVVPGGDGLVNIPVRTRSFITIQDGCNRFCAYCIVPFVRGREKSVPLDQVISEIRQKAAAGYREIVLTGTEPGAYLSNDTDLPSLLERVLAESDVPRLRLSSLQPQEVTPRLLALWRDGRLCPHFHLSLQSGSDSVLQRMGRGYSTAEYERAVELIRAALPEAAVTTDIIAGFPGETDAEFAGSLAFARRMGFARIHVFPFSPRPGTAAAMMEPHVPEPVKRGRIRALLALGSESARAFRRRFAGRVTPVLWEQQSDGVWSGLTGNYIRVYARCNADLTNRLHPARLYRLGRDGMWGKPDPL